MKVGPTHVAAQPDMGPVITSQHRDRVMSRVANGERDGAKIIADGRGLKVPDAPNGFYLGAAWRAVDKIHNGVRRRSECRCRRVKVGAFQFQRRLPCLGQQARAISGLKLRPASVRHSDWLCTIDEEHTIRLGLCVINGLRREHGARIAAVRPFSTLGDFQKAHWSE